MKAIVLAMLLLVSGAARADEIEDLLRGMDDLMRGSSSTAVVEMQVKTAQYERTMRMQSWSQGTNKTLVRILYPEKDAGVCTLKVDDNLWNYLPKVDRTMKIPAGMMSGSWMGSHLNNDDLVQNSRFSEHFTYTVDQRPSGSQGQWVITLVPKPDAPVVWGKVITRIGADRLPQKTEYFDEKGVLVRTMVWSDVAVMDGRKVPSVFTILPADKPGEKTVMRYLALDFDAAVDPSTFTLQALRP